jgi:glycosyltransferase involved in cell wall biosynthesis
VRILVLASTFPRWPGDSVPPFVHRLSTGLLARGHDVHVLAPHDIGAATREEMDGLHVHRFRYGPASIESVAYGGGILENLRRHPARWSIVPLFMASQFVAAVRIARRYDVDLIHAHWLLPQGLLAAFERPLAACPVVVTAHGGDVFAMRAGIRRRLLAIAARHADACTAVSGPLRTELKRLTGVEATVIPMGVDISMFSVPAAANVRSSRDGGRGERILAVGRLVEKKGMRHLIEAMVEIRATFPKATLSVVGEGPERPALEEQASILGLAASVQFTGAMPNTALPAHYSQADIVVVPSVYSREGDTEGLPVVLMEAAASGLAIVASDIGGIGDLVRHEATGLLVTPGDPHAIASAVVRLLSDDGLRQSLGRAARREVTERFSTERVVDQFDALFTEVRGSQHGRRL